MPRPARRVLATLALLLVTALPLAACDSDEQPQGPVTREDLRDKGCC